MSTRRLPFAVLGALLLAACGASSDAPPTADSVVTSEAPPVDLTDGLFEHNESPAATAGTDDEIASDDEGGTTTDVDPDASSAPVSTDGEQPADTTIVDTDGAEPSLLEVNQGMITVADVAYPFEAAICEVASDAADIDGAGTASDGSEFEATIFFSAEDFDEDGVTDEMLEIQVSTTSGAVGGETPLFYAFKSDSAGVENGEDITFEIAPPRISGMGPIADLNGVAFDGEPTPMTFDVRCG